MWPNIEKNLCCLYHWGLAQPLSRLWQLSPSSHHKSDSQAQAWCSVTVLISNLILSLRRGQTGPTVLYVSGDHSTSMWLLLCYSGTCSPWGVLQSEAPLTTKCSHVKCLPQHHTAKGFISFSKAVRSVPTFGCFRTLQETMCLPLQMERENLTREKSLTHRHLLRTLPKRQPGNLHS